MRRVHIHIAGRSDLGIEGDEDMLASIDEMKKNPAWKVGGREQGHGLDKTPLGSVLVEPGHPVPDRIVIVATSQEPAHPGDTLPIAEALRDVAVPEMASLADLTPVPTVEIVEINRFSGIEVMARIREVLVHEPPDAEVMVEIGSGPATLFNGVVLGVLASDRVPSVRVLAAGGDYVYRLSDVVAERTEVGRWFMRSRMWNALADHVENENPEHAGRLRRLADLEALREGGGNASPVNYTYSSILGDLARDDRNWLPKTVRLLEMGSARAFGRPARERTDMIVAYATERFAKTDGLTHLTPTLMRPHEIAFHLGRFGGSVFADCPGISVEFRRYWDGGPGNRGARRLREGFVRHAHVTVDETAYRKTYADNLARLATLETLLGGLGACDTESRRMAELEFGAPWSHREPVRLIARLVGTSENTAIESAVSRRFSDGFRTRPLEVRIGRTESINDLASCIDEVSSQLERASLEAFSGNQRVDELVVVLGQGTKVMNTALLTAGILFAFHNRVNVSFAEAVGQAGTGTEVAVIGLPDVWSMVGRLVDPTAVQSALTGSVDRLDIGSMKSVAALIAGPSGDRVRDDVAYIERVLQGGMEDQSPAEAAAVTLAAIGLIIGTIRTTGDADVAVKVSLLLSGATAHMPGDDAWAADSALRPIWAVRNDSVHLRFDRRDPTNPRPIRPTWPVAIDVKTITVALCGILDLDVGDVNRHLDRLTTSAVQALDRLRSAVRSSRP